MGHANYTNLSKVFVQRLYAKGKITIADAMRAAQKKRETIHASEGQYVDEDMLSEAMGEIAFFLLEPHRKKHQVKATPVIEVAGELSDELQRIYDDWIANEIDEWEVEQYELLDGIPFKFAPGWRKEYPNNIPLLSNVTH
jgi:hypothetical protein